MIKARQKSGGSFKPVGAGPKSAVLAGIVDLGKQANPFPDEKNPGHNKKPQFKVAFIFQVDEKNEDGTPKTVTKIFTNSMHARADLRKQIETWQGADFPSQQAADDFDFAQLLGKAVQVNIKHKKNGDKTYANVTGLAALHPGLPTPVLAGSAFYFSDMLPEPKRSAAWSLVPEWLQKKIGEQLPAGDSASESVDAVDEFFAE